MPETQARIRGIQLAGGPVAVDETGHIVVDDDGVPVVPVEVDEWVAWGDVEWCRGECGECGYID